MLKDNITLVFMSFDDELRLLQMKDKIFRSLRKHINDPPVNLIFIIDIFNVFIRKYQDDALFIKHIQTQLCSRSNDSVHNVMNSLISCYNYNLLNDLETYICF